MMEDQAGHVTMPPSYAKTDRVAPVGSAENHSRLLLAHAPSSQGPCMCQKGFPMHSNMPTPPLSTVPSSQIRDEVEGFSYNALAVLGPNYLIKRWLPKKGPAFVALIQAMRAHIFYNFDTREQQTKYFPEAETIAQLAGISRATVFRLLNDPDMLRFIRRERRRRWDKEMHKEVTTSNRYYVALDDPPTPEDEHLVREAQERLAAITANDTPIVDDDRPTRRKKAQTLASTSESQFETLIAVSKRDPDSSLNLRLEDRSLKTDLLAEGISIREGERLGPEAIRNADRAGYQVDEAQNTKTDQEPEQIGKIHAKRIESNRPELATPGAAAAVVLSEGEAWKVDARVAAGGIIASNLTQLGGTGAAEAVERVLSSHAPYRTPAEILAQLADIAKDRTNNRAAHIDEDAAAGYFIKVLCNLAKEARSSHYDLAKLRQRTTKDARKIQAEQRVAQGLPITSSQSTYMPRQGTRNRAGAKGRIEAALDYYDHLKPGL
jgi:hypothetical protein